MRVIASSVKCLKYDKEGSQYYSKGAFISDYINVWTKDGRRVNGVLGAISSNGSITLTINGVTKVKIGVDEIKNFEVVRRNNKLVL